MFSTSRNNYDILKRHRIRSKLSTAIKKDSENNYDLENVESCVVKSITVVDYHFWGLSGTTLAFFDLLS